MPHKQSKSIDSRNVYTQRPLQASHRPSATTVNPYHCSRDSSLERCLPLRSTTTLSRMSIESLNNGHSKKSSAALESCSKTVKVVNTASSLSRAGKGHKIVRQPPNQDLRPTSVRTPSDATSAINNSSQQKFNPEILHQIKTLESENTRLSHKLSLVQAQKEALAESNFTLQS